MRLSLVFAVVTTLSTATPVLANDSTAKLDAGGLQLTASPDITMEREDLYLSPGQVRVHYVFRNQSDRDITTRVAFPLPDISFGPADNFDLPHFEDNNFVGFSVIADGQRIEPTLEQRAISAPVEFEGNPRRGTPAGTDITAQVVDAGLPLNAHLPSWKEKVRTLPPEVRKRLLRQNIVYDDGGGDLGPQWSLRETYHWQQTFPAQKSISVEHVYKPVIGSSYFVGESRDEDRLSDYKRKYCLDSAGLAGVQRLLKEAAAANSSTDTQAYVYADEVGYILTTGANWKGPIGSFKLTIDKLDPHAIVSFCVDGTKKASPTTFTLQRDNFTPKDDLRFVVFRLNGIVGK